MNLYSQDRRQFLHHTAGSMLASIAALGFAGWPLAAFAQSGLQSAFAKSSVRDRILILVELKGGNDSLNTVIPYANPIYAQLRPTIGIKTDEVIRIDSQHGLHPSLAALLPVWEKSELAIVQGLGYPQPNLSHFRSIDIWNTASKSEEYLSDGWVARALQNGLKSASGTASSLPFTSEGVLIGINELGPLAGAHAVALRSTEAFVNQSKLAMSTESSGNLSLQHILNVENNIVDAAKGLRSDRYTFKTEFPSGAFSQSIQTAAQIVAGQRARSGDRAGVPVIVLSHGSFDTHVNQMGNHANLLKQLGEGLAALRSALIEVGAWDRTLVMTYSEFGRRARQNQSNGTDHGTAAAHFVMGGAVRGGLIGQTPDLSRLDASQNLLYTTDFRQLQSTIAKQWWGVSPEAVVRGRFGELPLVRG
jgi:uncharacterized protein (DUF1501 family)